ncbi:MULTISPECIES: hypothetical protein [Citrobacter]|uniref:Two-component-system connector protein YmgA n=1 Tax=Citrobacter cronae TaxID=1748967 RepID=A0ABS1A452_9ENTR|nr:MULTISPECIES: hypothetical protein [Citrobacter]AHY13650.1 hypothetical protein CFNIH1_19600 [Citrobacter freundii CFNIH1]BBV30539.1 two-component-system connector protein YmgA [Citrobacter freundii]AWS96696.1 hypothetical protein AN232_16520 [Citrobacter sp. CRE-46]AYL66338.1 hypothetical protein CUC50_09845 [Citrobacter werkmanii]KAA0552168.1 hypothetical protein F0329_18850 [Citrobacter werkmanii]
MKKTDHERLKHEITGLAVIQILRMNTVISLPALIKQLRLMKASEVDAGRRHLIDSIIHDFTDSNPARMNPKPERTVDESVFSGSKKPKLH